MTLGALPRMAPVTIGTAQVFSCVDAVSVTLPPDAMLKGLPEGAVEAGRDWLVPRYLDEDSGRLRIAYQSFVVRLGERAILIDASVGEDGEFPARPDWHHAKSNWLAHLGQAGLAPEDVDTVFLTHLHMDHTGWLTRRDRDAWVPTFPGARHLASAAEIDFWTERAGEFAYMSSSIPDSVRPVLDAGLVERTAPGEEIAPDLHVVDLAGHSPGMIGLELREGGRPIASFCADLMHHPLQMAAPGASTAFCTDPEQAARVRRAKLAEYAEAGTILFCNHFPGPSAGRAVAQGDGFRFDPISEG